MQLFYRIALAFVLSPTIVAAQATTSEGVQTLLRGDYEAAARILKPLAEGTSQPDPIAQFFLAALYDSGRGVARNQLRACSLYASAASPSSPLMPQALDIVQTIGESWAKAPAAAAVCAPVNTLPWGEASPASFTLGAGHWVRIDATGTTIGFGGDEHRTGSSGGPGIVYLPIQYTPVDVSSPVAMRRHFIQSVIWHRDRPADLPTWSLGWLLNEVVGLEMFMVAGDPRLATITSPQPTAIDTSRLVEVRVNATGEAVWAIKDPANTRGGIIPLKGGR